jgi:hemoglobin-like flavoprotein
MGAGAIDGRQFGDQLEVGPMSDPSMVRRPSPAVIDAVQNSCRAVAARPVRLAEEFYANLFEMAPQVRAMFPDDMSGQMQKMTDVLLGAIAQIATRDTVELEGALRRLGATHRTRYGVEAEHYGYIGHALTRAVREVAGPAYSGALSSSWIALYQWVAAHMIAGADGVDQEVVVDPARIALPEPRGPRDSDRVPAGWRPVSPREG